MTREDLYRKRITLLFTFSVALVALLYGTLNALINRGHYYLSYLAFGLAAALLLSTIPSLLGKYKFSGSLNIILIAVVGYGTVFWGDPVHIKLNVLVIPILMAGFFKGTWFTIVLMILESAAVLILLYPLGLLSGNDTMIYVMLIISTGLLILFYQHYRRHLQNLHVSVLEETIDTTIYMLGHTVELRDSETGDHLMRVSLIIRDLARRAAEEVSLKAYCTEAYISDLIKAATLHDIGKVGIADEILLKPGRLTEGEFDIIKTHSRLGHSIIEEAKIKLHGPSLLDLASQIALHHHERWDGTGYPDGLAGEAIPLGARLMALADVYDALRSDRPYKEGLPHRRAVEIIRDHSGTQFDPLLVRCFLAVERDLDEKLTKKY